MATEEACLLGVWPAIGGMTGTGGGLLGAGGGGGGGGGADGAGGALGGGVLGGLGGTTAAVCVCQLGAGGGAGAGGAAAGRVLAGEGPLTAGEAVADPPPGGAGDGDDAVTVCEAGVETSTERECVVTVTWTVGRGAAWVACPPVQPLCGEPPVGGATAGPGLM